MHRHPTLRRSGSRQTRGVRLPHRANAPSRHGITGGTRECKAQTYVAAGTLNNPALLLQKSSKLRLTSVAGTRPAMMKRLRTLGMTGHERPAAVPAILPSPGRGDRDRVITQGARLLHCADGLLLWAAGQAAAPGLLRSRMAQASDVAARGRPMVRAKAVTR